MYNNLISKNFNHFGQEGVIQYSKCCDYYNINKVKMDDIKMFYELLKSDELPNQNLNKQTLLSCCLYYLAKEDEKYKQEFTQDFIRILNRDMVINDTNLILMYNIIEYDKRYLKVSKERNRFLLEYLEKFSSHKKTVENFLLYKYYRGVLKFRLEQTNEASKEYLEIITGIFEYVKEQTKYINYIKLQNDLLKVQIDIIKNIPNEYYEQYIFVKELFDRIKNENSILAIKLGFCLYEILCRQRKYAECIPLLNDMKKILNDRIFSGQNLKTSIDYTLAIFSRMAFIGTLIGDKEAVIDSRKKLVNLLEMIKDDKDNAKLVAIYNCYDFCVGIINNYLGIFENRLKDKALIFRKEFIHNDNKVPKIDYLINRENRDYIVINLNSINSMDVFLNKFEKDIISSYDKIIKSNRELNSNNFFTYIVSIHNKISRLSQSYCTDISPEKRKDYIKNINELHASIFNYIMLNIGEPLLECDFIKSILINIQQACVSANFGGKNFEKVKSLIIMFDKLKKELNINEKTTSYELINKVKGDYWFKTSDYTSAISYYLKTLEKMKNSDPKRPIIYFNLGCSYYCLKSYKNALNSLNYCLTSFRVFEYEQKTYDTLIRRDVISSKVQKIKRLLGLIEKNHDLKN